MCHLVHNGPLMTISNALQITPIIQMLCDFFSRQASAERASYVAQSKVSQSDAYIKEGGREHTFCDQASPFIFSPSFHADSVTQAHTSNHYPRRAQKVIRP